MMQIKATKNEIIERLEGDIILKNKHKLENPECLNNTFGQFILVGEISMLEKLGILDEDISWKYINMAKGMFAKDIVDMYNMKKSTEELNELIPLYDKLSSKVNEK